MSNQDRVIIDENLENTFGVLNNNPSVFRVKDYAGNLPDDYADDFAYALFEACLTYNAKYTLTRLVLGQCRDENAGTKIENERFNTLFQSAKDANPNCKNGYLPMFFSYIQLVAEEPGITEEQNQELIAKFLNIISQDKDGVYPEKLYNQDEMDSSINLEMPIPAESFLSQLKEFYGNLFANKASKEVFSKQAIDSTLNQYIDDIYSLTYTDDDQDLSWFERTDRILEIEKANSVDRTMEILENAKVNDLGSLYNNILDGFVSKPLYKDGEYDFSYFSASANLLAQNLESFVEAYNHDKDNKIVLPDLQISGKNSEEYSDSCRTFIASYMAALISQKYDLENEQNDPNRLLDPNLKINLLKSNENIFNLALSEGKTEEEINNTVKELIEIANKLVNFAESTKFATSEVKVEKELVVTKEEPNTFGISSNEVMKYMLNYLKRQQKVYNDVLKKLEVIKGHRANHRHYVKDDNMFMEYAALYAPEYHTSLKVDELVNIVDRKADKFTIANHVLSSRAVINKLASCVELYHSGNTPTPVKRQELEYINKYITRVLKQNRCDQETIDTFVNIFDNLVKSVPTIKSEMNSNLAKQNFTILKSEHVYKKAVAFSSVIAPTLYMNKLKNQTNYRFIESIMPKKSLRLEQKYIAKDFVKDSILDVGTNLTSSTLVKPELMNKLSALANRFDENAQDTYIVNGVMDQKDKTEAVKQLREVYSKLPKQVKQDDKHAIVINLVDLIPGLIKKIPSTKAAATTNFINFVCEFVEEDKEKFAEELARDLKKVVENEENDPYGIKAKYAKVVPANEASVFEDLWRTLPKVTVKTRDKVIFETGLKQLIAEMTKDERTKCLAYYKQLFSPNSREFVAKDSDEKEQIDRYLSFVKVFLISLIEQGRNNPNLTVSADDMLKILETYANTTVKLDPQNENFDENN